MNPIQINKVRLGNSDTNTYQKHKDLIMENDCISCNVYQWNVSLPNFCKQCIAERVGPGNARLCRRCKTPISHSEYIQNEKEYCQICIEILKHKQIK